MRLRYSLLGGLAVIAGLSYSCHPKRILVQKGIRAGHTQVVIDHTLLWSKLWKSADGTHGVRTVYRDDGPTPNSGPADNAVDSIESSRISILGWVISKPTFEQRTTAPTHRVTSANRAYQEADDITARVLKKVQSIPHEIVDTGGEQYKTWRFIEW